jgi:vancomycin permeability regulator SanA
MPLQLVARKTPWKRYLLFIGLGCFAIIFAIALVIGGLSEWMVRAESNNIFEQVDAVPPAPVALVLGAGPATDYFNYRLDAAVQLYHAGKVKHFLVSGEGQAADPHGSETALMRQGLIKRGIPAAAITRDDYGFRTLDSIARARRIFQLKSVIIVSQGFHLPRALYLAKEWNLNAVGFAAPDPGGDFYHSYIREWLARVKALLDVLILHTEPQTLGPTTPIDLDAAALAAKH